MPHYIREKWEEYRGSLSEDLTEQSVSEIRDAFFSGAIAFGAVIDERGKKGMKALDQECGEFIQRLREKAN